MNKKLAKRFRLEAYNINDHLATYWEHTTWLQIIEKQTGKLFGSWVCTPNGFYRNYPIDFNNTDITKNLITRIESILFTENLHDLSNYCKDLIGGNE